MRHPAKLIVPIHAIRRDSSAHFLVLFLTGALAVAGSGCAMRVFSSGNASQNSGEIALTAYSRVVTKVGDSQTFQIYVESSEVGTAFVPMVLTGLSGSSISFKGGSFPGTGGTCVAGVTVQDSCTVVLEHSPTANARETVEASFTYLDSTSAIQSVRALIVGAGTTEVAALAEGSSVATGACALTSDDELKCWGDGRYGRNGLGVSTSSKGARPGKMGALLPFTFFGGGAVSSFFGSGQAGQGYCVRLVSGVTKCWGSSFVVAVGGADVRGNRPATMGAFTPTLSLGTGRRVTDMSFGESHTCAILDNARVKCWGAASRGRLGTGNANGLGQYFADEMGDRLPYVDLGTGRTAKAIASGYQHNCAILDNDRIKCWGDNRQGQLGYEDILDRGDEPGEMGDALPYVDLGTDGSGQPWAVKSLGLGDTHSCAVLSDDSLKCWGSGGSGRLGLGDASSRGHVAGTMGNNLPKVEIGTGYTVLKVVPTQLSTCALLDLAGSQAVKCWGRGSDGVLGKGTSAHLGDGSNEMGDNLTPIDFGTNQEPVQLSAGILHACVLLVDTGTSNQSVKCWGENDWGQLGVGDVTPRGSSVGQMGNSLAAVDLDPPGTIVKIASSYRSNCVLFSTGQVKCWGANVFGETGDEAPMAIGLTPNQLGSGLIPIDLGVNVTVVSVHQGANHVCAILNRTPDKTRQVKCWGDNQYGQLGLGDILDRGDDTVEMGDNLPWLDLGAGLEASQLALARHSTCVLLTNGRVKCWGRAASGQLLSGNAAASANRGDGAGETPSIYSPIDLGTTDGATPLLASKITAGATHYCVVLSNSTPAGRVKCWGLGSTGQLGKDSILAIGDAAGELGDSLTYSNLGTDGLGDPLTVTDIAATAATTCVLLSDGDLKCFGKNSVGELLQQHTSTLGDGKDDVGAVAVEMGNALPKIQFGQPVTKIRGGSDFFCAILNDASVRCWGQGSSGQLGAGSWSTYGSRAGETASDLPQVNFGTGLTAVDLSLGTATSCILTNEGTVKCVGSGTFGVTGVEKQSKIGGASTDMGDALQAIAL